MCPDYVTDEETPSDNVNFAIYSKRTADHAEISYWYSNCDLNFYPFLFPCGESGGHPHVYTNTLRAVTTQI